MSIQKQFEPALAHFKRNDPRIFKVLTKTDLPAWFAPSPSNLENNHFIALCENIIGQQLSGKAARSIIHRFHALYTPQAPNPIVIINTPIETLRSAGLSNAKATYLKNIAESVTNGSIDLDSIHTLNDDEVIEQLIQIKGIGKWTAEMFLLFTLHRTDVFSFGDLGLKKGISRIYGIEHPAFDQIQKIIEAWSPYKSFGSIALWQSNDY